MSGFYYEIYPAMHVGGGPAPEIYSVEQQNMDAREASLRIANDNTRTMIKFMELGDWLPRSPATHPEEAYGSLVNQRV